MSSGDSLDFIVSMCIITHVHTCQEISVIARASLIDLPLPAISRDYKITLLAAIFAPKSSYALFLPLVTSWVSGAIYLTGWSKAQESKQGRRKYEIVESALDWLTCPFPPVLRALIVKDIKTFLRDSTQWSQFFLLIALIIVYLYNFKVLPLDRSPLPTATLKAVVSFANLALAGFVLSAVAV